MNQAKPFWDSIKNDEGVLLATAVQGSVTMRVISPVFYQDAILIATDADTKKYQQLKENPHCCLSAGGFFMEAKVEFLGAAMREENAALREVYAAKFSDAFDEGMLFGVRDSDFLLLTPVRLTGWGAVDGVPCPVEQIF